MQITVLSLVVLSKPKGKTISTEYLEPIPAQPAPPKSILWNQYKLANEE
jgi:hypothetical protein